MATYSEPITPRQLSYLSGKLAPTTDELILRILTKSQAHQVINGILERNKTGAPVAAMTPASTPLPPLPAQPYQPPAPYWPLPMSPADLKSMIKPGYYAWRADDTQPFIFLRVKFMTYGKNKGNLKISQQHGPDYTDILTVYPSGQGRIWRKDRKATLDAILGVLVSMTASARAYAKEKEKCCICNTDLTVWRSRWYGIGPECEKSNQRVIDEVDDELGYTFEERELHGWNKEEDSS